MKTVVQRRPNTRRDPVALIAAITALLNALATIYKMLWHVK